MRVTILGLGLIGGSVARALRSSTDWPIVAWSERGAGPAAAASEGIVDRAAPGLADAVRDAELVVLGAPPLACLDLLDRLAELSGRDLSPDATVTDLASTKAAIAARADAAGLPFVGGHPMAGREASGFSASTSDLFAGRPWVTAAGRHARPVDAERVAALVGACGARQVALDPAEHDALVAGVSHLPLVVAAALVEAVAGAPGGPPAGDWAAARELAAGGWRDSTRVARGDATMAAGIAATNAPALVARLRAMRDAIDSWIADLDAAGGPDPGRLAERFEASRRRLGQKP